MMRGYLCLELLFLAATAAAFTSTPTSLVRRHGTGLNAKTQLQPEENVVVSWTKEEKQSAPAFILEQDTLSNMGTSSDDSSSNAGDTNLIISNSELDAKEESSMLEGLAWRGVVVLLCALWASNFAAAKMVMAEPGVDSSLYAVARFSVAAISLIPGSISAIRRGALDAETAKAAAICGGWVAFGYLGQTLGLITTTASKSCVICSLHCILCAIVSEWNRVSKLGSAGNDSSFNLMRLVPAAVAVAGVAIVELKGAAGPPTFGDLLSFAQPIGFGLGYLQLEEIMKKRPEAALPVSAIKLIVVALASLSYFELSPLISNFNAVEGGAIEAAQMLWPPRIPDISAIISSPVALGGILYTGLITTALALWVESIAFKRVPAADASIILTTEPLFAAGAAAIVLGETFGTSDYVGAGLIIGACILSVLMDKDESDDMCEPDDKVCVSPQTWQ